MSKNKKILFTTLFMILVFLNVRTSREKNSYKEYMAGENQKVLQRAVENLQDTQLILQGNRENGTISRSDLSLLGVKAQDIRSGLIHLQAESMHFLSEKNYDHEAYNILIWYLDGVYLFISMDLFEGQGNAFAHLDDPAPFIMDEEEKVLDHMLLISDLFITDLQSSEITMPDGTGGFQRLSHKKELSSLMTTVEAISEDLDAYLAALQAQSDQSELTLKFLEEVVYKE